ncbi:cysteine--1-D-myo-inosityl 2-amino-2-deoxy-alpha-D-glucopyranoside ligase [Quadrisphaera sp. DSM 44207]|uniref:cysteine--1-D-myo-inosityl 2-amino-2-deoxy-alpha-D-glucopyranoside ligase n=1 Tax=Quadrisphaera sp. DSM 44207 TaxID=1881057 RepID=UPI000883D9FC|nr:cysteine--1-D-myo-inosityl 2-amino-2-deoxy-alpha-D-glucopyranoside ligase [Quadrisphaera sp. DSM 44207]SDQ40894.1 L-cysteine:1D-myo-inositol 2-amino-2-deoxy-alpha-D-glucopyranoside ligase [Quadrisphaera sp. DSM 44207]
MRSWPSPPVPDLPGRGGPVLVHDTATGALVPAAQDVDATLYVCGITPYDATHLGHAATYLAFDLLQRAWRDAGHRVRYVQNVTDVDDPLLERARASGEDWRELAARESALFAQDMTALAVLAPDAWVGAVESIPLIATAVRRLLEDGAAYRVPGADGEPDGDVYFATAADPLFGGVSHLDRAAMAVLSAERGGDPDRPGKRDPLDPLLWRLQRPGEPAWDGGDLGRGRPGWHVECTVIAREHLGHPIDVQGGGSDLVFPHHEMGASHGHVLDGPPFARRYVHAGMVGLDGEKMSKSRGNLVLVSRLRAQGTDPAAVRLAVLAHHYRSDWAWTAQGLREAEERLGRWRAALSRSGGGPEQDDEPAVLAGVRERLAEDLDAPGALAVVDAWAHARLAGGRGDAPPAAPPAGAPGLVERAVDALLGVRL